MTKSELFKRMWIPVKKRIPPEDNTKYVLIWNYTWQEPLVQKADIAHYGAKIMLENKFDLSISEDRIYSHWMFVEGP